MRKAIIGLLVAVLALTSVFGFQSVDSQVIPGVVNMEHNDVKQVDYCIEYVDENDVRTPAVGIEVVVTGWCLDNNGIFGCQAADTDNPEEFSVTAVDTVTDADGCATLELETINADGGLFFYSVNGQVEGEVVTQETAAAYIPEMGVIGAGIVLAGVGLFVARRRKN